MRRYPQGRCVGNGGQRKLTEAQIEQLRRLRSGGATLETCAAAFDITTQTARNALRSSDAPTLASFAIANEGSRL